MRFFLFLAAILTGGAAQADQARWTAVRPDHFNLLYSAGEEAKFQIEAMVPTNPDYGIYVTVQPVGVGAPVRVALENGFGTFTTAALSAGNPSFEIVTHLTGPDAPTDQIMQDQVIQLQVNQ